MKLDPEFGEELALFDMPTPTVGADVQQVWNFYLDTLRAKSKNRTLLSDKRRKKIEKAIKLYGVEACQNAIRGCAASDWHMGRNGTGTKYDDIELILRDEQKIEAFIARYEETEDTGL